MALFQNSVLKKHLKLQDKTAVDKAYKKFSKYFHDTKRQQNIRESKEEQYQEGFLRELFVKILGYTLNPEPNFNLTTELKNEKNAKKTDGAILKNNQALAVIELKSTKTKDLESIRQQAFDYKANQTGCAYVITSNFEKVRFYINNAVDFEEFNLFTLTQPQFELLYLCLQKDNVLNNIPLTIKIGSVVEEEKITKTFYNDYSVFKRELFRDLVKLNMKNEVFRTELQKEDNERANKNIKQHLFKKSQKLIDRFLFIFFAEDRGLLPPNSTLRILQDWNKLKDLDTDIPLYNRFKLYFKYLDEGRKGTDKKAEIFAYNGGLFKPDPVLDSLILTDDLLYKHTKTLSDYDFESQVDVNILGHIFENSLNEIESVNAEIEGVTFDKQKTKRKKDGVFYTPKYITKYIVDNTIGKLCTEKKTELNIIEADFTAKRQKETKKKLLTALETYREWLLQLTILDPACGSGAFLNQALDFLIKEHRFVDELQTHLLGGGLVFPNIENTVLENNIFGVDLNEESVEIAKLSLWLRTAQPRRKLNSLNNNIKCGNSLIDSKSVAGDKAFHWETEFPNVFEKEPKRLFLVTFVTHNSRISDRMVAFNPPEFIKDLKPLVFEDEDYTKMISLIGEGITNYKIPTVSFTVIPDHVHLLCAADNEVALNEQIRKLKGFTSYEFQRYKKWNKGEHKVWAQKFNRKPVLADTTQVNNVINYIVKNVPKHSERWGETIIDNGLKPIAELNNKICVPFETAIHNKGGFDVVIGNPPYLRVQGLRENFEKESQFYEKIFESATGRFDVYVLFMEKSYQLIKQDGIVSFILPHKFLVSDFGEGIRGFFTKNKAVSELVHFGSEMVFDDASAYTCIINLTHNNSDLKFKQIKPSEVFDHFNFDIANYNSLSSEKWNLKGEETESIFQKLKSQPWTVKDVFENISQGVVSVGDDIFLMQGQIKGDKFIGFSDKIYSEIILEADVVKPLLKGENVKKYAPLNNTYYCLYPHQQKESKTIPFDEGYFKEKFPLAYNYILPFKDELIEKKIRYKTNPTAWYSLHRSREIDLFEQEKIVTPETSLGGNMTLDSVGYYHNTQVYTLEKKKNIDLDNKFWIAILNSSVFWFFLQQTGAVLRGGYFRFKTKYLQPFPLPKLKNIDLQNPFIEKVDIALTNTKEFTQIKNKFTTYLQSQFPIEKLTKKLQNWHELNFGDFIKELNKAIKKENKQRSNNGLQPIATLTKTEEMDWMDVFETKKAEAQSLKTEIDKTDKEIDQMVYKLYKLTDEEIKIVEASNQ